MMPLRASPVGCLGLLSPSSVKTPLLEPCMVKILSGLSKVVVIEPIPLRPQLPALSILIVSLFLITPIISMSSIGLGALLLGIDPSGSNEYLLVLHKLIILKIHSLFLHQLFYSHYRIIFLMF